MNPRWSLLLAILIPAVAWAEPKDDARRHFRAGLDAAIEGDYDLALHHFLAAQEAFPHPATVYNIAKTYTDLGDYANALRFYELYREQMPDADPELDTVMMAIQARMGAGSSTVTGPSVAATGPAAPDEGLSEVEKAQLEATAGELAALAEIFTGRNQPSAASNAKIGAQAALAAAGLGPAVAVGGGTPGAPADPNAPAVPDAPLPQGSAMLIEDAYERIVVTASRYGQDPLDSPSTITVLTAEDIRLSGVTSIPDVLRRAVGVDVMALSGGHFDISIRGFNRELNNKVIVLIDGKSTYWDFIGATLWSALPVVLEEIDRIEIIRGPASAVYGANAVTGVINIITKTPGEKPETIARVDMGTIDLARGSVYTNGRVGQNSYRLSVGYDQHGRWNKEYELADDSALVPFFEDQDRAQQVVRMHGRIDRTFGAKGYASLSGGYTDSRLEYYSLGSLGNFGMDARSSYLRGDLAWDNLHLRAFWNSNVAFTGPWLNPKDTLWANNTPLDEDVVDVEVESPVEFKTGLMEHKLNVGLSYRNKQVQLDYLAGDFDTDRYNQNHFAGFVNEEATVGKLKLVGSFRVDKHPLVADITKTMSPRAALIYRLAEATSLRINGGTAFRAPNILESYTDYELPSPFEGAYASVPGRPDLLPERITTIEAGVHDESSDYHTADVAVYYNRLTNVVWLPSVTQETNLFSLEDGGYNIGYTGWWNSKDPYPGYGVEAEAHVFPTDGMDVFANVDLQTVRIPEVTKQTVGTGDPVPNFGIPPLLKVNVGWMYRTPYRSDLTVMANYVSPESWPLNDFDENGLIVPESATIPSRFIVSGRAAVRPTKDEALELAVTGWNLVAGLMYPETGGFQEHIKGQYLRERVHGSVSYKF